jgi:hypothetical protein
MGLDEVILKDNNVQFGFKVCFFWAMVKLFLLR